MMLVGVLVAIAAAGAAAQGPPGARRQYGGDITNAIDVKGAFECPCLTSFAGSLSNVPTLLAARGFPAGEHVGPAICALAQRLRARIQRAPQVKDDMLSAGGGGSPCQSQRVCGCARRRGYNQHTLYFRIWALRLQ